MKRIIWIALLFTLALVGLYYANAYTSAMVENPVSLSVANPHGLIALIPAKNAAIMQGQAQEILTLTNNMKVYISWQLALEESLQGISLDETERTLAPGESDEIALVVASDCPPGNYALAITLSADFTGGRAKIKTTFPLTVIGAPQLAKGEEDDDEDDEDGDENTTEESSKLPDVPGEEPPSSEGENMSNGNHSEGAGNGESNTGESNESIDEGNQESGEGNTGNGSEGNDEEKTGEDPTGDQE